ncbi:molybdenum cofactor guanylyltransferase [Methanococcus maripaludis]|uniref:Probable molybdenum cofactor guanylyltransferase n=2 Tax=Methanococcus maripaludis TaxID=39152 RepID=A0A7J9PJ66_METMI|nr:molybdenum cofactor guanylyltransferase [Methanococcus maripaludis]MBA2862816.1 molybdopterin-guanine dinucleotide biosynthesis protein A [Methanococcus maripaludis]
MISAIILSGGKAERMGGEKSFRKSGNKYLIENIADMLLDMEIPFVTVFRNPRFMEKSESEIEKQLYYYKKYHQTITWDFVPEMGPLIGMLSGMLNTTSQWVFLVPCDMPFITEESIVNILDCIKEAELNGNDCIVPKHKNGFIEPLFSLYHISSVNVLGTIVEEMLEKNRSFPIRRLIDELNPLYVDAEKIDESCNIFINLNTLAELENACFDR